MSDFEKQAKHAILGVRVTSWLRTSRWLIRRTNPVRGRSYSLPVGPDGSTETRPEAGR